MAKVRVLEVDRFHGEVMMQMIQGGKPIKASGFSLSQIEGLDTELAKHSFGGSSFFRYVDESDRCLSGSAWFKINDQGNLVHWQSDFGSEY